MIYYGVICISTINNEWEKTLIYVNFFMDFGLTRQKTSECPIQAERRELALLKARKYLGIKLDVQYFLTAKFCCLGDTIVWVIKSALPRIKNRVSFGVYYLS